MYVCHPCCSISHVTSCRSRTGEGMKIVAFVQNNSSRDIKLKYCVYRKHSFFAMGRRRVDTKDLLKDSGDPIKPSANQTVTKVISIPHDAEPAIRCCSIIQAEYRLRVSVSTTQLTWNVCLVMLMPAILENDSN